MEQFLINWVEQGSYLGLFIILLAAGMGLPLPEDIPLLAGGYLVHSGVAHHLWLMILVGLAGVMAGDSFSYFMGRKYGEHIVEHRWLRRIIKRWMLDRAEDKFRRHGPKIIFAARFMPGLRAVMFCTAGIFRVPFWEFFLIDLSAAVISVPVWVVLGWYFGGQLHALIGDARTAGMIIGGVMAGALVAWIAYEYHQHRRRGGAAEGQKPPSAELPSGDTAKAAPVERLPVVRKPAPHVVKS